MGEVFLGHDPRLQRRVALKCLTAADTNSADARERILREARAAALLKHHNIAAVYDVIEQDDRTFIVMEFVDGESLSARLARGSLPLDQIRAIGRQLASALVAAHAQGVIHRDLKPANIHFDGERSIKVLDFGVAKLSSRGDGQPEAATSQLPSEMTLLWTPGTIAYMSPEQLFGEDLDGRSDIYSAGVILYQLTTGRTPFEQRSAVPLALAMSQGDPASVRTINRDVPEDLAAVIAKALSRDREARYQSAREFESALIACGAPPPSVTGERFVVPPKPPQRSNKRLAVIASAIGAIALTIGIARVVPFAGVASWLHGRGAAIGWRKPLVLAVLPVDNPTRETRAEYLGAGLTSLIARNFGSIPRVTVLPREATAPYRQTRDVPRLQQELGADYVVDVTVKSPPPQAELVARVRRAQTGATEWEGTITGDALTLEQQLLERLVAAFEHAGAWPSPLTATDRERLRKGPTSSGPALAAYSEARSLLDRRGVPENVARAIQLLEQALVLDPGFQLASAALGDAYLEQYRVRREPELAEKANDAVVRALRSSSGDDPWIYYSLGNVQWSTGRYQDAIVSLRRSLELQPDNDETHSLLARVLADRNEFDAAIEQVRIAAQIRPDYWRTYMVLGGVAYRAGRLPVALDGYRRASELQPNDPGPFSGLGLVYQGLGDLPQALGNYQHAVKLGPSATAYSNLGFVYYIAGRYDDAVDAWKHSLAIEPKNPLYHRNIGDAYRRLNQARLAAASYADAVASGSALLKVNVGDVDTISLIAVCEAKLGNQSAAIGRALEAVALAPASRIALQRSAEVHALTGQPDAALKDLKAAIERGYSRSLARTNDEFESLRALPAFQALVGDPTDQTRR